MGAKSAISLEEYLRTSFPDLDREYRDGEVVERSLPDDPHSKTQFLLLMFFGALCGKFPFFPRPELRMRIRPEMYLIPDVAVFYGSPPERVPQDPPLVAIEILSSDDRMSAVRSKLEAYRAWGVKHVWLVDPQERRMYTCDQGLAEVESLRIPELELELTPAKIFDAQ